MLLDLKFQTLLVTFLVTRYLPFYCSVNLKIVTITEHTNNRINNCFFCFKFLLPTNCNYIKMCIKAQWCILVSILLCYFTFYFLQQRFPPFNLINGHSIMFSKISSTYFNCQVAITLHFLLKFYHVLGRRKYIYVISNDLWPLRLVFIVTIPTVFKLVVGC